MRHSLATQDVFRPSYTFADGMLAPSEAPDRVDYDDAVASAHPYGAAYLPVNRLLDGTMHDW